MNYVDLYLIHQPIGDIHGTWRALEEIYEKGYARAVGVSNFDMGNVTDLSVFHREPPHVNQVEMSLFCQQKTLSRYLKQYGVISEAWGIFAKGDYGILENAAIRKIGRHYGKTPAQIILRWLVQRGVSVLIQTENEAHMKENLDIFDFSLENRDLEKISELDTGMSVFTNYHLPETIIRLGTARFHT